jgi:hypothetical protein
VVTQPVEQRADHVLLSEESSPPAIARARALTVTVSVWSVEGRSCEFDDLGRSRPTRHTRHYVPDFPLHYTIGAGPEVPIALAANSRLQRRLSLIEKLGAEEKRQILQFPDTFLEREQLRQRAAARNWRLCAAARRLAAGGSPDIDAVRRPLPTSEHRR